MMRDEKVTKGDTPKPSRRHGCSNRLRMASSLHSSLILLELMPIRLDKYHKT